MPFLIWPLLLALALGDSEHLTEKAKNSLTSFINNIFAPIFFVLDRLKVGIHWPPLILGIRGVVSM